MKKQLEAVLLFHKAFKLGTGPVPVALPDTVKPQLRYNLMKEENEEYLEAALSNNLTGVADALGDILYVLCGTIIEHGLQHKIEEVFDIIQESNMSKLGADGQPIYREDGKVIKGPGYKAPDFSGIFKET